MKSFLTPKVFVGTAISILALWLAVRDVPFGELGNALQGASYVWLIPAVALHFLSIGARAQRWVVLLGKQGSLADSFWAQSIGYLFTNILPLRAGEPARVIAMAERCRLPILQVAASAVVERLLDLATILLILLLVLPWMQVPMLVIQAGQSFGAVMLVALVALLLAVRLSGRGERILQSVCNHVTLLPRESILARWRQTVDGLAPLKHFNVAVWSVGWSSLAWASSLAINWSVLRVFEADASLVEAAFMQVALALAVTIPSSPGFIGVFQLAGQQALVLPFGAKYTAANALAITMVAHMTYYLLTSALGVAGLWKLGSSLARVGRVVKSELSSGSSASKKVAW
ncbi:MAG: flippase-like domain-containing protein [Chloroflexi bacterium]|nr:flippase-like domain-containing protein [Chloroflexota bacterium]